MLRLERFNKGDHSNLISWITNAEMLIQIAGWQMKFPVTEEQLDISQADKNRVAFSIINSESGKSVGHCELYMLENSAKIDRLIIGDSSMKGKGLCSQIMTLLLEYGFDKLAQTEIELNVFDWNTTAIRCYEKSGFKKNANKTMEFETNGENWIAFNMSIDKKTYEENKNRQ